MIEFTVWGEPATKGSLTAIVRNGKARMIPGGSYARRDKVKAWRDAVEAAVLNAWVNWRMETGSDDPRAGLEGALVLRAVFYVPKPKKGAQAGSYAPKRPDLDKYVRSLGDHLTDAGLIEDDSRFVRIEAEKRYDDGKGCRAEIRVEAA